MGTRPEGLKYNHAQEKIEIYDKQAKKVIKMLPATFDRLKNNKIEGKDELRFQLAKSKRGDNKPAAEDGGGANGPDSKNAELQ